ncbi:PREDICTED: transmembrane protein 45A isoform X2 [Capra hircus]|uniref:transmembrane protein 45A isoform X2 n=1 Tax=Capra hircus TaxID=9925 RepID=UPI000846F181|nr:PREDICTED: transmembrane protein 45A isoform X2 [Capra hircus]
MGNAGKVMGDFKGHAFPGFILIILGIWWTTKCVLKYAFKKQKPTSHFDSKALFYRTEMLEGIVVVGASLIGILAGQFVPGGPHLILYDYKKDQWVRLLDWHHFTMYLFFGLLGVTNILCSTIRSLPASFSKLMLLNALFVEGLVAFTELFIQANITVELLRTSLFLLQGSWFWQIGFVLYPLNGGPPWDLADHNNIMFLTMCFCWHYATAIVITGAIYAFVTWLVKSRFTRFCPSEVELLKNAEREQDSEEEM